jgi:hypothetical protein
MNINQADKYSDIECLSAVSSPLKNITTYSCRVNRWDIPEWLENEVRARDKECIYCGVEMLQGVPKGSLRNALATWEHIINDAQIITRENIALCCSACNSSKGQKTLSVWLQSPYCVKRGVNEDSVAQIAKDALWAARNGA